MVLNFIVLFISLANINFQNLDYDNWELKKDKDSIKVYIRNVNESTKEYRAETIIRSDIDNIFNTITDFDNSYKWMYKLNSSKILKKTDSLMYVYFVVDMSWPLKNRDLVSDAVIKRDIDKIKIEMNSTPDYIPLNNKLVRINKSRSIWNLEKIDDFSTKVTLQSYAVVDGIPIFIMDLFILDSPMYSMTRLREKF
ncbi:MAG: hypothetical protein CMB81_01340 [Flammeovirgaceae bacterium]|nr:hypothetical protein [Flammeovirgaceae bacterium]